MKLITSCSGSEIQIGFELFNSDRDMVKYTMRYNHSQPRPQLVSGLRKLADTIEHDMTKERLGGVG